MYLPLFVASFFYVYARGSNIMSKRIPESLTEQAGYEQSQWVGVERAYLPGYDTGYRL